MRDFIKVHLGPTLRREHPSLKLLGFDHNKDAVARWARVLYSDPEAAQFVDGLGVHWCVPPCGGMLPANHSDD
jgi:glucosylceramidase